MSFPKEFLFASSSAAYQVEGAWDEDGKGESIWDHLTHTRPHLIKNHDNGDIACNSYHLYKEDVKWLKYVGFDVYRFSINWPRILPNGEITEINQAGVNYYHNLIDILLKNNIQPMITIYHWDLPQKFQDMGGWTNPLIIDYVEDYADLLFQLYGDKVKWWLTINEPMEIIRGYETGVNAPALNLDSPANYIVGHHTLLAHARIYRLYDRKYRAKQNGKVTISLSTCFFHPKTDSKEDTEAADRAIQFHLGAYAHPIYTEDGDYPAIVRKLVDAESAKEGRKRSRLPTFTAEEIQALRGSFDFFSLNHYTTMLCSFGATSDSPTFLKDMNVTLTTDPSWPSCQAFWLKVVPWGFRELLKFIKNNYNNPPVFVTESGYCDTGELEDMGRIAFYKDYLAEVLNAKNNFDCNIIGYTAWSILDNFEWTDGYDSKFGLIHVDFNDENRKRTPKKSAEFFKKLLRTRQIPEY